MSFFEQACRRWPFAHWIAGNGPWAVIADCSTAPTIELAATSAEALKRLQYLHGHACCELYIGQHRLINLAVGPGG
jgi:hypothetical protein